jgi:DNA-binding GntR family transcriptional regulator
MDGTKGLTPVGGMSYRHVVGSQLRKAIASGELPAGERLNEVDVAKRLGVSPTPVREAFRDLEQAGLIVVRSHRGAIVRPLTHRDLSEVYSLRAHLEQMAIRLAHPRLQKEDFARLEERIVEMEQRASAGDIVGVVELDVAFHRYILERADHDLLLQTWENIHPSRWTYITVQALSKKGPLYIARRHRPLLKALRADSVQVAIDAVAEHIEMVGTEALRVLDDMSAAAASGVKHATKGTPRRKHDQSPSRQTPPDRSER